MNLSNIYNQKGLTVLLFNLLVTFMLIDSGFSQRSEKQVVNNQQDYRIITSNESYIEIEFTPEYKGNLDFQNSVSNVNQYGDPDILFRTFPLFFPGVKGNSAEVVDSKYEEIQSVDVLPVPTLKNSKD